MDSRSRRLYNAVMELAFGEYDPEVTIMDLANKIAHIYGIEHGGLDGINLVKIVSQTTSMLELARMIQEKSGNDPEFFHQLRMSHAVIPGHALLDTHEGTLAAMAALQAASGHTLPGVFQSRRISSNTLDEEQKVTG